MSTSVSPANIGPKMLQLRGVALNYAWGKIGKDSKVAQLASGSDAKFCIEQSKPYAELWMGTHPKAPCVLADDSSITLADWLQRNADCVGTKVRKSFPDVGKLPFLFKVLSVNISLSIQAHPDKALAQTLHREKPEHYPDANHKPEMAIALSPFECLCGFRPQKEILGFLATVKELRQVVGEKASAQLKAAESGSAVETALKSAFSALLRCDKGVVQQQLSSLTGRLSTAAKAGDKMESCLGELLLRVSGQFPGDTGCFAIYFLNRILLQPGQALFIEANLPHAYLSGDCVECMACSDNVLRAGLTPKFVDAAALSEMLDYRSRRLDAYLFAGERAAADPAVTVFNPPVDDFTVASIQVPPGVTKYQMRCIDSGSILLCIDGKASLSSTSLAGKTLTIQTGTVIFISANEQATLSITSQNGVFMFRAYCQL